MSITVQRSEYSIVSTCDYSCQRRRQACHQHWSLVRHHHHHHHHLLPPHRNCHSATQAHTINNAAGLQVKTKWRLTHHRLHHGHNTTRNRSKAASSYSARGYDSAAHSSCIVSIIEKLAASVSARNTITFTTGTFYSLTQTSYNLTSTQHRAATTATATTFWRRLHLLSLTWVSQWTLQTEQFNTTQHQQDDCQTPDTTHN